MKNLVTIATIVMLTACGQQPADQATIPAVDSITAKTTTTEDSIPEGANVKADTYYDKTGIENPPKAISTFIPENCEVLDTCSGDLNLDGNTDMLVLLRRKNEQDSINQDTDRTPNRILLMLTGAPDASTYQLAAQNDKAVLCYGCGGMMGDPYQSLVIKNGYFSIEHYGGSAWRWTRTITFKYSAADSTWYLHKDGGESFHAADPDKTETKVRTTKDFGKVLFKDFDIYKDQ